ncbi:hypothetical protein HRbin37_01346 [bacterium HR37]|nr:hypothetical protein HRbin37_01346 [bacterium HR37]
MVDRSYNLPYIFDMTHLKNMPGIKQSVDKVRQSLYLLHIGPQGRVVIPAPMRKALGVKPGDMVVGWIEGDKLILQPRRVVEQELWSMFRKAKFSSKELIAERREEAKREDGELG